MLGSAIASVALATIAVMLYTSYEHSRLPQHNNIVGVVSLTADGATLSICEPMGSVAMGDTDAWRSVSLMASPLTTLICKDSKCCLEIMKNAEGFFVGKHVDELIADANRQGRNIFAKLVGNGYRIVVY